MWKGGERVVRRGSMECVFLNVDRWVDGWIHGVLRMGGSSSWTGGVRCGWTDAVCVKMQKTITGYIAAAPGACAPQR